MSDNTDIPKESLNHVIEFVETEAASAYVPDDSPLWEHVDRLKEWADLE